MSALTNIVTELAPKFKALFAGLDRAYGFYDLSKSELKTSGKTTGRAVTRSKELTVEIWEGHLAGKSGLGVIPITDDDTVRFGTLDVDGREGQYVDFDVAKLALQAALHKLPLVVCRSKSGGAHMYLFAAEDVTASNMRSRLSEMAHMLGLPKNTEIFPKQISLRADRGDIGGWINMPYFDLENTNRYGLDQNGERLSAEEFLEYAATMAQPAEFFSKPLAAALHVTHGIDFSDAPPCLQAFRCDLEGNHQKSGLYNIALFLKRKYPDDWPDMVFEVGTKVVHPPVPGHKIAEAGKKAATKASKYTCNQEPLQSLCNPAECRKRKYGVGEDGYYGIGAPPLSAIHGNAFPELGQLRKLTTDPPVWFLDVAGKSVMLSTEELQSPKLFQKRVMEECDAAPPVPTVTSWQRMLSELLKTVKHTEAPEDSSDAGILWELIERWCLKSNARDADEILNGRPWTHEGTTYFRMFDLVMFLKSNHFNQFNQEEVVSHLMKKGTFSKMTIRGRETQVWGVPEWKALEPKAKSDESDSEA